MSNLDTGQSNRNRSIAKANYYSSLTVSSLMVNNITTSSLYVNDNLSISGDIFLKGNLSVSGSVTSLNIRERNRLIENISTGSIHVGGLSVFRNVSAFKVRGTSLLASTSIGIGTNQPSSTLDIVNDGIASINLQGSYISSNAKDKLVTRTKIYSYDDGNTYIQSSGDILFTDINSTRLKNICLKSDGMVGILTTQPTAILDVNGTANFSSSITAGALCVPTNGEQPVIDTNLYNNLMIYEDFLGESLRSNAKLSEGVIYSQFTGGTTGYLQLTTNEVSQLGFVYWNFNIGNTFTLTFDHYAGDENGTLLPGADEISFLWGGNILDDGYEVSFNEYLGAIELIYNRERMAYYPVNGLGDGEWHTSTIIFYRNIIRVIYDGIQVLAHLDTSRDISNKNYFGFKGRTGGHTNYHRIRNIRLSKLSEGLWNYQSNTCSNILYNYGNVGIGTSRASYRLDVCGNARISDGIDTSSISVGGNIVTECIKSSGGNYALCLNKNEDSIISDGDICGIDSQSKLTDNYDEAVTFIVKSSGSGIGHMGNYDKNKKNNNNDNYEPVIFCGITPVNVYNAKIGDYIIPNKNHDGKIEGISVSKKNITFEQYTISIGIVINILDDGRANIIIK